MTRENHSLFPPEQRKRCASIVFAKVIRFDPPLLSVASDFSNPITKHADASESARSPVVATTVTRHWVVSQVRFPGR